MSVRLVPPSPRPHAATSGPLAPAPGPRAGRAQAAGPSGDAFEGGSGARGARIRGGALELDGRPTFLYGGDLHYFRVRDARHDPERTRALWAESLDAMVAAGMNLVSTYVPWDYHAPGPGVWDFEGSRDLRAFLELVRERGLKCVLKPGPLITGEWPRGVGTFGAVPEWWKEAHPGSMTRAPSGRPWSFDFLFGDPRGRQPTYLDPDYLAAVGDWYSAFAEQVRGFVGDPVVGIQVDNETNQYWGDFLDGPGRDPQQLDFWRGQLRARYGDIKALNAVYGTGYADFDAVEAPVGSRPAGGTDRRRNPALADWYEAGLAYCQAYLEHLRAALEARGLREPDVVFLTNDAPFVLPGLGGRPRTALVPDGRKRSVGPNGLDLYPKIGLRGDLPANQPFQADYFVRLNQALAGGTPEDPAFTWAAELQGGLWSLGPLRPRVPPEATEQLLCRAVGRGLKSGAFYVMRDGLNLDGSVYDYQAALGLRGERRPRFEVMQRWGRFLDRYGEELLRSRELTNSVAILHDPRLDAPADGLDRASQEAQTGLAPGLFGWLQNAGINPVVLDARKVTAEALRGYKLVVHQNLDVVAPSTAALLVDYAKSEGTLVNFGGRGASDPHGGHPPELEALSERVLPGAEDGRYRWPWFAPRGTVNLRLGDERLRLPVDGSARFVRVPESNAAIEPFAWETGPLLGDGRVAGYVQHAGSGRQIHLGATVYESFNDPRYYRGPLAPLADATRLADWIVAQAGEQPIVRGGGPRELVWARRGASRLFLFCVNDHGRRHRMRIELLDADRLGLDPERRYLVEDAVNGRALGVRRGAELLAGGLELELPRWGATTLTLTPVDGDPR
jgi:hypothetical protein